MSFHLLTHLEHQVIDNLYCAQIVMIQGIGATMISLRLVTSYKSQATLGILTMTAYGTRFLAFLK